MKQITVLALAIAMLAGTAQAQSSREDRRTISVTGTASTYVKPDRATVTIGVESDGKSLTDAKEENDERISDLLDAVRSVGIPEEDIQTSNLSVNPIYDHKSDDRRLIKYVMRNQVTITIKDLDMVEEVINKGLGAGNLFRGLHFYVEDPESVRDSLRVEATMDAKAKADKVAGALGVTVGKPVSIQVSSHGGNTPQFVVRGSRASEAMLSSDSSSYTEVSSGSIKVEANVSIVFEIE